MRVIVNKDICVGAGQCVLAAPDVFDQDDNDGVVELLHENPPAGSHENVLEAASLCPAAAIKMED